MMKLKTIALLALIAISLSAPAAEPEAKAHWYQFTIQIGGGDTTYSGSSLFTAFEMKRLLADPAAFIELDNLSENAKGAKIYIRTTAVVYFIELPSDPAEHK